MAGVATSVYLRIPFTIDAAGLAALDRLLLRVRYDDGFAAYINGVPVASASAPSPSACSS